LTKHRLFFSHELHQSKLLAAKVLYVNITGTSLEIMKNLVLAGVQADIFDGRNYAEAAANTPTPFIHRSGDVKGGASDKEPDSKKRRVEETSTTIAKAMQPFVHELNPLLEECHIDERPLKDIPSEDFAKYDVVIASRVSKEDAIRISNATVEAGGKFFCIDCFGLMGCAVLDMGKDHLFRKEEGKDKLSEPTKNAQYLPFEKIISLKLSQIKKGRWDKVPPNVWAVFKSYMDFKSQTGNFPCEATKEEYETFCKKWLAEQNEGGSDKGLAVSEDLLGDSKAVQQLACLATAEVSPVCAVLGGAIGNEVIKCLSGKGEPANNVLLFDGLASSCRAFVVSES
jgi:ubiquitin-like 1-activating enzyme E1 A